MTTTLTDAVMRFAYRYLDMVLCRECADFRMGPGFRRGGLIPLTYQETCADFTDADGFARCDDCKERLDHCIGVDTMRSLSS